MPLQGLVLVLFMIITIPLLILFANQNVFFIMLSIILLYASFRNVYFKVFTAKASTSDTEEELSEELEQTMNVNVKKFKDGISVSKNLIIMLFFIYCIFIVSNFPIKISIALILTYRLKKVLNSFQPEEFETKHFLVLKLKATAPLLIDLLSCAIIIFISVNKYFHLVL